MAGFSGGDMSEPFLLCRTTLDIAICHIPFVIVNAQNKRTGRR
jgi:hypothetical protein